MEIKSPIAKHIWSKSIAHNKMFYRESLKIKKPNYHILCISWIMKQSYTKLCSKSSQYDVQSSHTVIQKLVHTCTDLLPPDSLSPLRNPCWRRTLNEFDIALPWLLNSHRHLQCVCRCISCIAIVTTNSQLDPFTYLSIGSPLDLTCM